MVDENARLEQFFADLATKAGTAAISSEEAAELLDLARVVAHTAERKYAPLATYAAGLALDADLGPEERAGRIRAVKETVARERADHEADA